MPATRSRSLRTPSPSLAVAARPDSSQPEPEPEPEAGMPRTTSGRRRGADASLTGTGVAQPEAEEHVFAGSSESDDEDMPLDRSFSVHHRGDDRVASLSFAAAVTVLMAGVWMHLELSWRELAAPQLEHMLVNATSFWEAHPIVLDEDLAAFKDSRNRWHRDILIMRDHNRAAFDAMLQSGEVADPKLVALSLLATIASLYVLVFMPDASIFLSYETRQRPFVRVGFNSVGYIRRSLCLLAVWQMFTVHMVLSTAMSLASELETNVKKLHQLTDKMLQNADLDPDLYELKAYTHEQRRCKYDDYDDWRNSSHAGTRGRQSCTALPRVCLSFVRLT